MTLKLKGLGLLLAPLLPVEAFLTATDPQGFTGARMNDNYCYLEPTDDDTRLLDRVKTTAKLRSAQHRPDLVAVEAIRVCGKAGDPEQALRLFQQFPSEATRTMTISILGGSQRHLEALELLCSPLLGPPLAASFNAAIAACGKAKDWQAALDFYQKTIPVECKTTVTVNALLTVLSNCKQGLPALQVYRDMTKDDGQTIRANAVTHQLVISALTKSGNLDEAFQLLEEIDSTEKPYAALYDLVSAAFTQRSDWKAVERVERLRIGDTTGNDIISIPFHHWEGLEKVDSSWKIGSYRSLDLTVGIRPNRNPGQNGLRLTFYQEKDTNDDLSKNKKRRWRKLGYLLMQNTQSPQPTSSLLGMFLDPTDRGQGLAKSCLSIWIWLCLQGNILPVTGIIRKPLLALILQQTFHFCPTPSQDGSENGVLVELCRDPTEDDRVILYSSSLKSLEGAFSNRDLKNQNLILSPVRPSTPGRKVTIICPLNPPEDLDALLSLCNKQLTEGGWKCDLTGSQIHSVFLGLPMTTDASEENHATGGTAPAEEESK